MNAHLVAGAAMSPEDAAWFGAAASLFLGGAMWLGHYLTCTCSHSRRCRTARAVQSSDEEAQNHG